MKYTGYLVKYTGYPVKYTDNPVQYVSGENQMLLVTYASAVRGSQTLLLAHGSIDTSPLAIYNGRKTGY